MVDRRQRRRALKTERLLDHAMAIVRSEGRDALTMPRLAAEADAAVGGLYRYFDGKDALLVGLQVRAVQAFDAALAARLDPSPPSSATEALGALLAVVEAWAAFAQTSPELHALIDDSLSHQAPTLSDDDARAVDAELAPVLTRCGAVFVAAETHGALSPGDPRLRTHALWAVLHGTDHFRKRDRILPRSLHAATVTDYLVRSLLLGWGAPPALLDTALKARRSP